MKLLVSLLLLLTFNTYAQNYKSINKAEKLINTENPNFKKIERILKRAEKSQYGFCGNAKMSALSRIQYIRAKMLYLKSDYTECINLLDSGEAWIHKKAADSLKVLSLIKIHGKEKVKSFIEKDSEKIIIRDSDYLYKKICINFDSINYNFCFNDQDESFNYKKEITIGEIIQKTNFYHLLYQSE